MALFSRKTNASPKPRIPAGEEVAAAGRALQVRGDSRSADRLVAEAGPDGRAVAMSVLAAAADYPPKSGR